jgi:hypothetical protein
VFVQVVSEFSRVAEEMVEAVILVVQVLVKRSEVKVKDAAGGKDEDEGMYSLIPIGAQLVHLRRRI